MWGRKRKPAADSQSAITPPPERLRAALRQARIEAAEHTGVVVDLRDAEIARLELLNDALDPLFDEIPDRIDLFDRGISRGEQPKLWIDAIAHVVMGRDKRTYRFLQDSRFGRKILAESTDIPDVVAAVTDYVARRMVERERALAGDTGPSPDAVRPGRQRRFRRALAAFAIGIFIGIVAVFAAAWLVAWRIPMP
jgi:hypothetical protein